MRINSPLTNRLLVASLIVTTTLALALTRADAVQDDERSEPGYTNRTHSLFDWSQTTTVAHRCANSDGKPDHPAFKNACNPEEHRLGFNGGPYYWDSPQSWPPPHSPVVNTPVAPPNLNGVNSAKSPANGHASNIAKPAARLKWATIPQLSGTLAVLICVGWLRIKR